MTQLSPPPKKPADRIVYAFWGALILLWIAPLGLRVLIHPDEGRYAELSLHILQSGDWVTPRLNGILYFEKPILQYWIGAISMLLFGINEFSARLWPGLAGILTVLTVGMTARRLWDRQSGLYAAMSAAGTVWIILNSHILTLDTGVTFFLTLTLCGFLLAQQANATAAERQRFMLLAWAAIAGAVLSKGLIGLVIPAATLVIYSLVTRRWDLWGRMHWLGGIALMLALTAPWFILVAQRNPDFLQFFFIHEHFQRFLTTKHHRSGPVWYFLPILLFGLIPWTSLLPSLLRHRPAGNTKDGINAKAFVLSWAGFVFCFFSLSGSKLPSYILPVFPALALLLGNYLAQTKARNLRWHLLPPAALALGVLVYSPFMVHLATSQSPKHIYLDFSIYVAAGAAIFLALAMLAWQRLGRDERLQGTMAVVLGSLLALTVVIEGYDGYGKLKSSKEVVATISARLTPATAIYSVQYYDQTFPFYLQRPVILVDYRDEFGFGQQQEPDKWIPTLDAFISRWNSGKPAIAMMTGDTHRMLLAQGLRMKIIYEDPRRLVVQSE